MSRDNDGRYNRGYSVGRREVLIAAGAAAGGLIPLSSAEAAPTSTAGPTRQPPPASPVTSTIASAPASGFVYRDVSFWDFTPENPASQRSYGGSGVYTATTLSTLWATLEIPAGAQIRTIEWYVFNNTGATLSALGRLWAAGEGNLATVVADTTIATNTAITATLTNVPTDSLGPYPPGTKLNLGISTSTDATAQVNGARVGFGFGDGTLSVRPNSFRAYSSQDTGGKFAAGETRAITLAAANVQPGTNGLMINVTTTLASANGFLKVYGGTTVPPAEMYFTSNSPITEFMIVAVPATRVIKVFASTSVHVIIDVLGTVA